MDRSADSRCGLSTNTSKKATFLPEENGDFSMSYRVDKKLLTGSAHLTLLRSPDLVALPNLRHKIQPSRRGK
jgi:hypothetical protein